MEHLVTLYQDAILDGVKIVDETFLKLDEFTVDAKGNLHEIYLDKSLKKYPHPAAEK